MQIEFLGLHLRLHHGAGALHQRTQIHRNGFEFEPPRFDLGIIEDVVDDGEERLAGLLE